MLLPSCLNVDLQMPLPNSIIIEEEGVAKELCLSPSEICPEKVSKDTRQSILGYFAIYPRINGQVSKDMSFPDFTRHFSYSQTESMDSVVEAILNQLADWSPGYIG